MEIYSELSKAVVILSKNFLHILFSSSFLSLALMHISKYILKLLDDSTIRIQKGPKLSQALDLSLNPRCF